MTTEPDSKPRPVNRYQVADLVVDVGRRRVTRADAPIELGALNFDLLRLLVASAPNVVTYDELAEKVWGRHFVSPENVVQRVKLLRQSLGDDASEPRYIETVRSKGYRLIPSAEPLPDRAPPPRSRRLLPFASAAAVVAAALAAGAVYWLVRPAASGDPAAPTSAEGVPGGTSSPEALALYSRVLAASQTSADRSALVRQLDVALGWDPDFADAYALKAFLYATALVNRDEILGMDDGDLEREAKANAARALAIDAESAQAHLANATVDWYFWRWSDAFSAYERAYDASPNDVRILLDFGEFLSRAGRHERAIRLLERAVGLDQQSWNIRWQLGVVLGQAGRTDDAVVVLHEAESLAPEASQIHHWLAQMAMAAGDRDLALTKLRYAEALFPGLPSPRPAPILVGFLYSYSCIGQAEDVARLVAELEKSAPRESLDTGARTLLDLALGHTDEAYRRLEAAVAQIERHEAVPGYLNLFTIKMNPHANPVLEQPRFRALRARIGALD